MPTKHPPFAHVHCHTQYSLLDGLADPHDMLTHAKALGMTHMAITDHGTMAGCIQFYQAAHAAGITPILGIEAYVARRGRHYRDKKEDRSGYHLILLAQNMAGYRNLVQLATKSQLEGFHYKPRIDKELLTKHSEGLICTSACLSSEISRLLLDGRIAQAEAAAGFYRDTFPGRFYIEIQDHGLEQEQVLNPRLLTLAKRLSLPLVATNDVHYITSDHAHTHEVLLAVQTRTTMSDPTRMRMGTPTFYLRSGQEMATLFRHTPEALTNTQRIAESCHLELPLGQHHLPQIPLPSGETAQSYLERLAHDGLEKRYNHVTEEMQQRLTYELKVIEQTGFAGYFLLLEDMMRWARNQGILCGKGRGSAVGSLVAYCLRITDVEPLSLGLLFERFLNPDRPSLPDIDSDFQDDRRGEVVRYLAERYGSDHVAQISTYGVMAARSALKDTGRALGLSYAEMDALARLIPPKSDLAAALGVPEFGQAYRASAQVRALVDTAQRIESTKRHAGVHAAGVVISPFPMTQTLPLTRIKGHEDDAIAQATQYQLDDLETLGFLKLDVLGLSTLRLLRYTCDEITRTTQHVIDPDTLPLDDPALYDLLSRGETIGLFQIEGSGMVRLLRQLQPQRFEEVMAAVALYRPGPMAFIDQYISCKHGRTPITYKHQDLEPIISDTYSVIVYQDQVLRIALDFAGLTWGQVDKLRKAMGKKLPKEMAEQKDIFVSGFSKTTRWQYKKDDDGLIRAYEVPKPVYPEQLAHDLWEQVVTFSGYGFNRAHSAAYATLACQTAYLKAHFPLHFLAGMLTIEANKPERLAIALAECRRLHIAILGPDLSMSGVDFHVEGEGIRYGLGAVRNLGEGAIEKIGAAREAGPFSSFGDVVTRLVAAGLPKKALDSLIKGGTLDQYEDRRVLLANLERFWDAAQGDYKAAAKGQLSLFGTLDDAALAPTLLQVPLPITQKQLLAWEKEILGTYLSPHPLHALAADAERLGLPLVPLAQVDVGQRVQVGVQVSRVRTLLTKHDEPMAILELEDLAGRLNAVCFPAVYSQVQHLLLPDALLVLRGMVTDRDDAPQLIIDHAQPYEQAAPGNARVVLHFPEGHDPQQEAALRDKVAALVGSYRAGGMDQVEFRVPSALHARPIAIHHDLRTSCCPALLHELDALLGPDHVEIVRAG